MVMSQASLQGLTVHSALRQSNLSVGEWVVILGAGGGLGHLGKFKSVTDPDGQFNA